MHHFKYLISHLAADTTTAGRDLCRQYMQCQSLSMHAFFAVSSRIVMPTNLELLFCKHGVAAVHAFETHLQQPKPAFLSIIGQHVGLEPILG